ncbi:RING/U-box [Backusella circina FSU 941]|nr:RING/U-box [Backusella circina FSU 941]
MTEGSQEDTSVSEQGSGRLRTNSENNRSWQFSQLVTMFGGSRSSSQSEQEQNIEEYDSELSCPICQEIMKEVYVTQCGHSFCHECIATHISDRPFCPICRSKIALGQIYPNYQLNRLTQERYQQIMKEQESSKDPLKELDKLKRCHPKSIAVKLAESFSQSDLTSILNMAVEARDAQDQDVQYQKKELLQLFLEKLKHTNEYKVQTLLDENALVIRDLYKMSGTLEDKNSQEGKRKHKEVEDDEAACTTAPLPKVM